jgi:hypothetical protein
MNKSANYTTLSIVVTNKSVMTVTYNLAHSKAYGGFTWKASTGKDRMLIDSLEIGERYFIRTMSDQYGTQHWVEAKKMSEGKMANDVITQKVAASKGKPQVRSDLLDW